MYAQLSEQYRKIGQSLYQKRGSAFVHCAVVPRKYNSLVAAVKWYEDSE